MRYLYNNVIKSTNVSLGKAVKLDTQMPKIIKKVSQNRSSDIKANGNFDGENRNNLNFDISTSSEEEILEHYMEEARKKSELFFENEMKKAYGEGLKKAEHEAEEMLNSAQAEADRIVLEANKLKEQTQKECEQKIASLEPQILSLSVDIAKKVILKEISEDNEYIINIVKDALSELTSKKDIVLKVSDKDYTTIIGNMDILLSEIPGFSEVNVVKDASLKNGSCILDTEYGTIDGSVDTRLSQIQEGIYKLLNS